MDVETTEIADDEATHLVSVVTLAKIEIKKKGERGRGGEGDKRETMINNDANVNCMLV